MEPKGYLKRLGEELQSKPDKYEGFPKLKRHYSFVGRLAAKTPEVISLHATTPGRLQTQPCFLMGTDRFAKLVHASLQLLFRLVDSSHFVWLDRS